MDNLPQPISLQSTTASGGWMGKILYSTVLAIFILAAFAGGFLTGRNSNDLKSSPDKAPIQQISDNSLIDSKPMAVIAGKITGVRGKTLSITNSKGVSGEIEASDKVVISKPTAGGPLSGSDLSLIELNKEVTMTVQINSGVFQVVSIIYPPSPVPPVSTPSAQIKNTR